jgi:glyoxylate reductase
VHSHAAQEEWQKLSDIAELVTPKAANRSEFIEECQSGALDGVLAVYRTFPSVSVTGRVDEELVKALPKGLKFICHNGMIATLPRF